jgi:hypothetical protein
LTAKTSYRRRRTELIVGRLEAERKELDIGIEAELGAERKELDIEIEVELDAGLEAERKEVESSIEVAGKLDIAVEVASIEVAKVGRMRLYSEVAEKVGQADLYASNLLAFLEDLEVEAVAEHTEVAGKLDTAIEVANIAEVAGKFELQNLEVLYS